MINRKLRKKTDYAIHKKIMNNKFTRVDGGIQMRFSMRKMYNILKNSKVDENNKIFKLLYKNRKILDTYNDIIITRKNNGELSYDYDGHGEEVIEALNG